MYALRVFALLIVVATSHGFLQRISRIMQEAELRRQQQGAEGQQMEAYQRIAEERRRAEVQRAGEAERLAEQKRAAEEQRVAEAQRAAKAAGPKRYYYESSLTWDSSAGFCDLFEDRALCTYDELCPKKDGARKFIDSVIPGDHWVAVKSRDWVEIGTLHGVPCIVHSDFGHAKWGEVSDSHSWKGYVYCCRNKTKEVAAIDYRYIGGTATYQSSETACTDIGRRLCHSSEVCTGGKPVHGTVNGDYWVAVSDQYNEWTQIGNSTPLVPTMENLASRRGG